MLQVGGRAQAKAEKLNETVTCLDKTGVTNTFEFHTREMFAFLSACPFPKGFAFFSQKNPYQNKN